MTRKRRRPTIKDAVRVSALSARNAERVQAKVDRVVRLMTDADRHHRLGERECVACFYLRTSRVAGQAFTAWRCRYCDHEGSHPNTAVPACCNACSDELHLCVECGGDLGMRHRQHLRRDLRRPDPCGRCHEPAAHKFPVRLGCVTYWLCGPCRGVVGRAMEPSIPASQEQDTDGGAS